MWWLKGRTNDNLLRLPSHTICSTLTAVGLIRAVPAVVIGVTAPGVRDAALVGAGELIGQTRSRRPGGTVGLVAVVKAVVVAVAAPD